MMSFLSIRNLALFNMFFLGKSVIVITNLFLKLICLGEYEAYVRDPGFLELLSGFALSFIKQALDYRELYTAGCSTEIPLNN